jgi:hypothetical protein
MASDLYHFLAHDHDRLDGLLNECVRPDGSIDMGKYSRFRSGILRHIWIEERVLFPEIRRRQGETAVLAQLHRDHAAISALLVPPPTRTEIDVIKEILGHHNPMEENEGGLYETVEQLVGPELEEVMSRINAFPTVREAPHTDTPIVRKSIDQLVREAEEGRRKL